MGDFILVLIFTCIICAGVPLFAFACISGKIKFPNRRGSNVEQSNRRVLRWAVLILGTFFGCFMFPVYNFTKNYRNGIRWASLWLAILGSWVMGVILARAFPYKKGSAIQTVSALLGFNCLHIFAGMGCRYLLEFGEASNTYNFTVPNVIVHLLAVNAFCLASWYFVAKQEQSKRRQA